MARRKRLPDTPFDATIERLAPDGSGVLHHDGNRLKAFAALPGEEVSARYRFGRQFRGQAEVLEIKQAAAQRVAPPCPVFGTCGGCALQHMDLPAQLSFKQDLLRSLLQDQGRVQPQQWLPALTAGAWGYRRKARLSVRDVPAKGGVLVGFREQDGRFVAAMDDCKILDARLSDALPALQELMASLDARTTIPQFEAACGDEQVALVIRHLEPLSGDDLAGLRRFAANSGFVLYLQSAGPASVVPLDQPADLRYHLDHHDLEFRFGPMDFIQVNAALNGAMIDQAMAQLQLLPEHRVLDLFCGLGNFSLPLARHCREVVALEGDAALVQRAVDNATHNGIDNAQFQVADLYAEALSGHWPGHDFDRILLDPPRSGAAPLLALIAANRAQRVVYVSCNPETLARDAGNLVHEQGFTLESAGIMDMFPHTAHVESMAVFTRS
jgi:23S rRNA (uracil1939-C5)-methyltransferase